MGFTELYVDLGFRGEGGGLGYGELPFQGLRCLASAWESPVLLPIDTSNYVLRASPP